jgi:hypothetical protein
LRKEYFNVKNSIGKETLSASPVAPAKAGQESGPEESNLVQELRRSLDKHLEYKKQQTRRAKEYWEERAVAEAAFIQKQWELYAKSIDTPKHKEYLGAAEAHLGAIIPNICCGINNCLPMPRSGLNEETGSQTGKKI